MPPRDRIAVGITVAAAALRFLIANTTSLTPDEAYYAAAAVLGTTVPDHPPLVVLMAQLGRLLPNTWPLELRLRFLPLVIGAAVSLLVIDRVRREEGSPVAQRWAAVLASLLLLPMAGGFLATPDLPVFLATLVLLETETHLARGWNSSCVAFAAAFLGMTAKVVMAPVVLAVAATTRHRWQRRVALLTGLVASLPFTHESLAFQLDHAFAPGEVAIRVGALAALAAAVVGQLALWTPVVPFLAARAARQLPRPHLAVAGSLTALFLLSAALRGIPPEPNWLAPAYAPLLPLAAHQLACASRRVRVLFVLFGPAATFIAASHVLRPWLPLPAHRDPSARLHGAQDPSFAGVGPYAAAALRCTRHGDCEDLAKHIQTVRKRIASIP